MKPLSTVVLAVLFVASLVLFVAWAHRVPSPQAFVVPEAASTAPAVAQPVPAAATSTPAKVFTSTMTTYFFIGEPADASNDYIQNSQSYWDDAWSAHFGGIDDPTDRCGYRPCSFTPKENPFYVALPYGEFTSNGETLKGSAHMIPWYSSSTPPTEARPLLKNHWVEVTHNGHACFGQWEDVGPNNEDDFAYVFGSAKPANTFGEKAGLDVSPALWDCLGMTDNDTTSWRFVDESDVSPGPWKDIITSSGISWGN